jgi:DNA polymerase III subunit alpha, Gram-positive type
MKTYNLRNPNNSKIVFYDFETTGLNPHHDKIIEIGAISVHIGQTKKFNQLVDPQQQLSETITKITKIQNSDLVGKPTIEPVLEKFIDFILDGNPSEIYLVAHNNNGFDSLFLSRSVNGFCQTNKKIKRAYFRNKLRWNHIDTKHIFQKILPERYSYSQKSLATTYGVEIKSQHRAFDDVRVLMEIYKRSCKLLTYKKGFRELTTDEVFANPHIMYEYSRF